MKSIIKLSAVCAAGLALATAGIGSANAAGPYSCSNSSYGYTYSSCSTNNTANQSSTVATASTVLRTASSQTSKLVANRVGAALSGAAPAVKVASNGFSASTGMAGGDMAGKLGVWASGSWSGVEDSNSATAYEGDIVTGLVGADYQVTSSVVAGLSVGYEDVDIDTEYNGYNGQDGSLEGDGYTIAPYVGVQVTDKLSADLTLGYSDIEYDTVRFDPNTGNRISGSTDAERYFVTAGVSGTQALPYDFLAKIRGSFFYATEDKDAFTETESDGTTIAVGDETTELGQIFLDTRWAYQAFEGAEPYALIGLEYDIIKDDVTAAAGQSIADDDFGAKFGAGVNVDLGNNITGGFEAYTVEFREDYDEYTATANLRVKF